MNDWEKRFDAWLRFVLAEWEGRQDHGEGIADLMWDELQNGLQVLLPEISERKFGMGEEDVNEVAN